MSHLDLRTMRITHFGDYSFYEQRADGVFNSPLEGHTPSYLRDTSMVNRRYLDFGDELYELDEEEAAWNEHDSGPGYVHHRHCSVCGDCGCTNYDCMLDLMYGDFYGYYDYSSFDDEWTCIEDNPEVYDDLVYDFDPIGIKLVDASLTTTVDKPQRRRGAWNRTDKHRSRDGGGGKRSKTRRGGTWHRGQSTAEAKLYELWERADRVNANRLMREICAGLVDPDDCSEAYMRTTGARW